MEVDEGTQDKPGGAEQKAEPRVRGGRARRKQEASAHRVATRWLEQLHHAVAAQVVMRPHLSFVRFATRAPGITARAQKNNKTCTDYMSMYYTQRKHYTGDQVKRACELRTHTVTPQHTVHICLLYTSPSPRD